MEIKYPRASSLAFEARRIVGGVLRGDDSRDVVVLADEREVPAERLRRAYFATLKACGDGCHPSNPRVMKHIENGFAEALKKRGKRK